MKKFATLIVVLGMTFGLAFAEHGHGQGMKDHEEMSGMGKMVFKGAAKGVKVRGYLNDMESAMEAMTKGTGMKIDRSKMDPNLTHHISFMISGSNITGEIKGALLKLSFKGITKDYLLMSMQGHFGADISLKEKGAYRAVLIVETEKAGKVEFNFNLKE